MHLKNVGIQTMLFEFALISLRSLCVRPTAQRKQTSLVESVSTRCEVKCLCAVHVWDAMWSFVERVRAYAMNVNSLRRSIYDYLYDMKIFSFNGFCREKLEREKSNFVELIYSLQRKICFSFSSYLLFVIRCSPTRFCEFYSHRMKFCFRFSNFT